MNKSKRLGIIIGTAILSIILVVVFSTVAVRSTTVKKSVDLGNKYLAEGNYEEAIIAFEKAIKIDSKNIEVKETLDVLYIYEEINDLFESGDYIIAQEKIEEIKDMPKFDIIKESFKSVESNIQSELVKDGMGNSIQNILAGGYIAYKGEYVFYKNIEDNDKLYRLNTKNNENIKLSDDIPYSINIYEDYVYYDAYTYYEMYDDTKSVGIKRVKFDGSESELVVDRENISSTRVQIIDNILYYSEFKRDNGLEAKEEIIALDLKTNEKNTLISIDGIKASNFILVKNSNDGIDLIINPILNSKIQLVKNIEINESRSPIEIGKGYIETNIIGIDHENIYYVDRPEYSTYMEVSSIGRYGGNIRSLISNLSSGTLGSEYLYYVYDNKLIAYALESEEGKIIKNIDINISNKNLYEVNGYLAYYDNNKKLIIDKDIKVTEYKKKENQKLDEDKKELEDERKAEEVRNKKNEFLSRMAQMGDPDVDYWNKFMNNSNAEMVGIGSEMYNEWNALLNEIWSVLQMTLDKDEMDILTTEQLAWIEDKDQEEANINENRAGAHSNFVAMNCYSIISSMIRERCYELVNNYM